MAYEGEELLVAVARFALGEHRAGGDVQSSKQCGSPVADVIMGEALDIAKPMGSTGWVRFRA
jgi:hypothetical protein